MVRPSVQWQEELERPSCEKLLPSKGATVREGGSGSESCRQIASPGDKAGIDERYREERIDCPSARLKVDDPTSDAY